MTRKSSAPNTVEYLAGGWPARRNRPQDGPRPCASLAARILQGDRESCPTPTVWRVTTTRSGLVDSRYWCDACLPDEDRPTGRNST